jgi:hypothetical protein
MKKDLFLLVALLLCSILLPAQRIYEYTSPWTSMTTFSYSCTGLDDTWLSDCRNKEDLVKTEVPPWIIGGGWRTYFLVDGIGTTVASSPASITNSSVIDFHTNGGDPVRVTSLSGCPNGEPWRLQYYCTYSAQYINHPAAGPVSLAFVEGENYRQVGVDHAPVDCDYRGWDGASGFVCGSWIQNTQSTNWGQQYFSNDMGPIVWPSTGYFNANGYKTSNGCANNSTIQADDGYLYVFYKDQSHNEYGAQLGPGRQGGIKVARAPINDALNPKAYQSFYEDGSGIHWNPSLPHGFEKNFTYNYIVGALGPQASLILDANRNYNRFSVAKVEGTNYYLGVGSYSTDDGYLVMVLKFSYDLLHWYGDREIDRAPIAESQFNYPIFLREDGWTNTSINESSFFILGTDPNPNPTGSVYKKYFYIPTPPSPQPPAEPGGCIDQWNNPIPCPMCTDGQGRQIDCGDHLRKATTGNAKELDNSKERAPFVYPNPGPGTFRLTYTLKGYAKTQLNVLDLTGRLIQTGTAASRTPGTYTETVNITTHAKGVYLLELMVNGKKQTFKVIYQ